MKPVDPYRKIPKQSRSQSTVEAILEASARILQADGGNALTTNAIAQLAGISIGTLYQYFPDKNAILIALARQEMKATEKAVTEALASSAYADKALDPIRFGIRALLKGFKGRQRARKALIEALMANGLAHELASPVDNAMLAILAAQPHGADGKPSTMTPVAAYVMTRAIIGTLRAAVMEQSTYLGKPEFEDELVKLARGMLAK